MTLVATAPTSSTNTSVTRIPASRAAQPVRAARSAQDQRRQRRRETVNDTENPDTAPKTLIASGTVTKNPARKRPPQPLNHS